MTIISEILIASLRIFQEAALYIILGFIVAGIIRVYVQPDSIAHYLHKGRFKSVLYASIIGIPIPL